MQKRSVASVVILTLVTCGIYGLYWTYCVTEDFEREEGPVQFSPIVMLLLCLFTGCIGYLLFGMQADELLNKIREKRSMSKVDNKVVYMILGFFIPIVLIAMVQDEINKLSDDSAI